MSLGSVENLNVARSHRVFCGLVLELFSIDVIPCGSLGADFFNRTNVFNKL